MFRVFYLIRSTICLIHSTAIRLTNAFIYCPLCKCSTIQYCLLKQYNVYVIPDLQITNTFDSLLFVRYKDLSNLIKVLNGSLFAENRWTNILRQHAPVSSDYKGLKNPHHAVENNFNTGTQWRDTSVMVDPPISLITEGQGRRESIVQVAYNGALTNTILNAPGSAVNLRQIHPLTN